MQIFTNSVGNALNTLIADLGSPKCIVITDVNVDQFVMPILAQDCELVRTSPKIVLKSGDENKNLDELRSTWSKLLELQATRNTLIINIGGGVVSDLGGFAASTFKRGMKVINIPTTLLSAVDASVGGKTGINYNGVKNVIGTFSDPEATIISTLFFNTLPQQELLSGYAEMIKHALLEDEATLDDILRYSVVLPEFDSEALLGLLEKSVLTKRRICELDPTEKGPRKILNFGHTVGHAFEALAMKRQSPIPHGYAVAWGMVVELILSHSVAGFPSERLTKIASYVQENYGSFALSCNDYPDLLALMRQDKKNRSDSEINFTLLKAVGQPQFDTPVDEGQIKAALDIYRDLFN